MAEKTPEYDELKLMSNEETSLELETPQVSQSINYLVYNCLASLEFMISAISLIFYVAFNTCSALIILSGLGLFALSIGFILSYFAVSRRDSKIQTYALITFCVAALLCFVASLLSLNLTFSRHKPTLHTAFYESDTTHNYPHRNLYPYPPYYSYYPNYNPYYNYYNPYSNPYYNPNPYYSPYYNPSNYNGYSPSSSLSVSYSYSYSYSYTSYDPYEHTVSYSFSYSSNSNPSGSSYTITSNYNDYSPYNQNPYVNGYWFTESDNSPFGSNYTSYNPLTGARSSSVTFQSPDPTKYQYQGVLPSEIYENKPVGESKINNVLPLIMLFVIQGLLFVALITQANFLRSNLKYEKVLAFEQSIVKSEPQKI